MIKKLKITPINSDGYRLANSVDVYVIGYTGLNENDGVFAISEENDIITFYSGDDGSWRPVMKYHKRWIPQIIDLLKTVGNTK